MSKLFYQLAGGGTLINVYDDPSVLVKTDLEGSLSVLQEVQSLSDDFRSALAQAGIPSLGIQGGYPSLADFDDYVDDEADRISDIIDYFDYGSVAADLTVRDGSWYVPEAVEQFSDETVGGEAVLAIDGENSTHWQSEAAGERSITFRVRGHRKKFEGIRLRTTSGDLRAQLQGVSIRAAASIGSIDEPGNEVASGVDFAYDGDAWMESMFTTNRKRYIKLVFSDTLHASDQARIKEIQVRVGVTNHDK